MKRFLPLFFAYFAKKIAEKFASSEKSRTFASLSKNKAFLKKFGKVVEWSITAVLKTAVLRGTGGSNPSLSAERTKKVIKFLVTFFVFCLSCRFCQAAGPEFLKTAKAICLKITVSPNKLPFISFFFFPTYSVTVRIPEELLHKHTPQTA